MQCCIIYIYHYINIYNSIIYISLSIYLYHSLSMCLSSSLSLYIVYYICIYLSTSIDNCIHYTYRCTTMLANV